MGGAALPYDAEVEYLQTTGTQYIDTGVKPTQDTDFYAEFAVADSTVNTTFFLVWDSTGNVNDKSYGLSNIPRSNTFQFRRWGRIWISSGVMQANTKYTYRSEANKIYIDDVLKGTGSIATFSIDGNLILFAENDVPHSYRPNKGITPYPYIICYAFRLYNSGVLIRDFIPVRKGTVGYMYDRVSGQLFGNAGTGSFILGPDIMGGVNP